MWIKNNLGNVLHMKKIFIKKSMIYYNLIIFNSNFKNHSMKTHLSRSNRNKNEIPFKMQIQCLNVVKLGFRKTSRQKYKYHVDYCTQSETTKFMSNFSVKLNHKTIYECNILKNGKKIVIEITKCTNFP